MCFGYGSCGALAAMAHRASKLIELVRNHGMRAEGLRAHVGEAGFLQTNVATRAAIDDAEVGQPDLLNLSLEMALECNRIAAVANHLQIAVLIMPPLAEVVFSRSDRQRSQEHKAYHAERANAIPEQCLP